MFSFVSEEGPEGGDGLGHLVGDPAEGSVPDLQVHVDHIGRIVLGQELHVGAVGVVHLVGDDDEAGVGLPDGLHGGALEDVTGMIPHAGEVVRERVSAAVQRVVHLVLVDLDDEVVGVEHREHPEGALRRADDNYAVVQRVGYLHGPSGAVDHGTGLGAFVIGSRTAVPSRDGIHRRRDHDDRDYGHSCRRLPVHGGGITGRYKSVTNFELVLL